MRNILLILLTFFSYILTAQTHKLPDQQQIKQVLKIQQNAWNNGDIPEFMEGYWKSDSLTFIGKKGITKGWKNTLDNYLKSYPDKATMGKLAFVILRIEMFSSNTAMVTGKWDLERDADKGNIGGYFTLIFKKINKRWVIVSDHTS